MVAINGVGRVAEEGRANDRSANKRGLIPANGLAEVKDLPNGPGKDRKWHGRAAPCPRCKNVDHLNPYHETMIGRPSRIENTMRNPFVDVS